MSRHRIDALTLYASPSSGPHGFHALGRTVESSLRSFNNLLERLHASFFFYLIPRPDKYMPVGHYLPSAVLLGASLTLGGFDCPAPLEGILWMLLPYGISLLAWVIQQPLLVFVVVLLPRPQGEAKRSLSSLTHLLYGAYIPTLAMVNYPQSILLAILATPCLMLPKRMWGPSLVGLGAILTRDHVDWRWEWEVLGNVTWPAIFAVLAPLWGIAIML